jgi:hypothetical protein
VTVEAPQPVEYPRKRPDPYRRDPGAPFDSLEREQYAKARAKGASVKAASVSAGVSKQMAYELEKHDAIRARIRELRQGAEDYVGFSKAWILQQLKQNAEESRNDGAWKSSNEALGMMYKIMSEDRDVGHQMARALPPDVTPRELQKALRERFNQKPALPKEKAEYVAPSAPVDTEGEESE